MAEKECSRILSGKGGISFRRVGKKVDSVTSSMIDYRKALLRCLPGFPERLDMGQ